MVHPPKHREQDKHINGKKAIMGAHSVHGEQGERFWAAGEDDENQTTSAEG